MLKSSRFPISRIKFNAVVFALGCLLGFGQRFTLWIAILTFVCALSLPAAMDKWSVAPWGGLLSLRVYLMSLVIYLLGVSSIFFISCEYLPGLTPCATNYLNSILFLNVFFGGGGGLIIAAIMSLASKTQNR
jgi:hypothetical protein